MDELNLFSSGSNRLPVLAHEIKQAHEAAVSAASYSAERAIEAGQLLLEAKASVGHGQWLAWLERNVGISERSARRYMQLARSGLKSATVADLGMTAALQHVARHRFPEFAPGVFVRLSSGPRVNQAWAGWPSTIPIWHEFEAFLWSEDGSWVHIVHFWSPPHLPWQDAATGCILETLRTAVPAAEVRSTLKAGHFPLPDSQISDHRSGSDLRWIQNWCKQYPFPVLIDIASPDRVSTAGAAQ